ncbi:hypothetical protein ElyMa_003017900 [Elysia marginata]|uniref:Uncharacterized protein n=1 Tax=Elysia marginata TaxID=1093978 RepID=A0AAV4IDY8_9GAST|nr:hypothetical protein ElyMa_003017900 [Elysia marginata]
MKLSSLKLVVWILWLFIKQNQASELSLTYPGHPDIVYLSLPLQGVCTGKPGPGGQLRLEVRYYAKMFGEYNYYVRNKSMAVWKPMEKTVVKILPDPDVTKLAFKFCVSKQMLPSVMIRCTSYNYFGVLNGVTSKTVDLTPVQCLSQRILKLEQFSRLRSAIQCWSQNILKLEQFSRLRSAVQCLSQRILKLEQFSRLRSAIQCWSQNIL